MERRAVGVFAGRIREFLWSRTKETIPGIRVCAEFSIIQGQKKALDGRARRRFIMEFTPGFTEIMVRQVNVRCRDANILVPKKMVGLWISRNAITGLINLANIKEICQSGGSYALRAIELMTLRTVFQ